MMMLLLAVVGIILLGVLIGRFIRAGGGWDE